MKKIFLTLASLATLASAQADLSMLYPAPAQDNLFPQKKQEVRNNRLNTRADEATLVFGYCGNDINFTTGANSAGSNGMIGGAIYIPAELAEKWQGNKLTGVIVGYGTSSTPEAEIFLTEEATWNASSQSYTMGTPVLTQTAEMELQNDWNEVTLNTPYTITGKGFYVGYNTDMKFGDRPLALDAQLTPEGSTDNGDLIGINEEWVHGGPWFGRICLKLVITGDNLPKYDVTISDLFIPTFVGQNEPYTSDFFISNNGTESISSVTIQMSVDGKVISEGEAIPETPLASGESAWLNAEGLKCEMLGANMEVTASVVKINGESNIFTNGGTTGSMSCSDITYDKNVLIEEFTGTWCGWCPRGIVGMEYMKEHYGDQGFIPIAGHSGDEMQSTTYYQVVNTFSQGSFPSAVADRSYYFDPSATTMEEYFLYLKQYPSFAQVNLEATYNEAENNILLTASTEFALDFNGANYALGFVLCQNGVGPYAQTNYFAIPAYKDEPGGGDWYNYGGTVAWTYDEVARTAVSPFGAANSVPSTINKGIKYNYETTMPAGSYALANCYVVGILLDTSTYRVVNSTMVNIGNVEAGVESLVAEPTDGIYRVYNLNGVKVLETKDASAFDALPKGVYIVNGKKVMK